MTQAPNCLIIGAGPGMGTAIARRFAREGFRILLLDINDACIRLTERHLRDEGFQAVAYQVNAADLVGLQALLSQLQHKYGPVDVLVYNAVQYKIGNVTNIAAEPFMEAFRVDVVGALVAAQHMLPTMQARGQGTILLTGGSFADNPLADFASLSMGKAGIRLLAQLLDEELSATPIKVGTITICGWIVAGTRFDPHKIAECFWDVHTREKQHIEVFEVV
ncbi:short-chain dehydrogenase [Hymenobacter amundsenii]|uniref:Short-chain dehydrogenase n=1 Tax=Hymenobacter amundsenii TaxID=2006685 RepID=A0A246FG59_9BACT|nr:SDR family NAD(P)-dependent oxidoreductase [Hymenobacter amundsenii]OWP61494.1 short-chain dehydrogenase [Hymenobacter amundsenii]